MGYADLDDVESGFRTLSDEERNRCFYLLEEAAAIIDAYGREADPDVKRLVSCRMVRRLLGDGTGGETPLYPMGATQGSATALSVSTRIIAPMAAAKEPSEKSDRANTP